MILMSDNIEAGYHACVSDTSAAEIETLKLDNTRTYDLSEIKHANVGVWYHPLPYTKYGYRIEQPFH
jgi:hypothetical protein